MTEKTLVYGGDGEGAYGDEMGRLGRVGPYRLEEVIGEGGMGIVYRAEQEQPVRRQVALKLVKPGMDTETVLSRFEAERQAVALMSHPNIAKLYEAGTTEHGRAYFAMEFCPGQNIAGYCDERKLSSTKRLELFSAVCEGVQHAHQKGIIHRDLKPSNVLVTEEDGRPVPKIIDFGLAKATDSTLNDENHRTVMGQVIGTPAYMSPEQAELGSVDIDTRTDVYSLGVLLYELLVGTVPFDIKVTSLDELLEMRRRIREDQPPRPSRRMTTVVDAEDVAERRGTDVTRLVRLLRGDLDWIVMRAMEKDRQRRYATPINLKLDLSRYLTHQPVEARPPSRIYRFKKLVRRHYTAVAVCFLIFVLLTAGVIVSTSLYLKAEKERLAKVEAEKETQRVRQAAEAEDRKLIDTQMEFAAAALGQADKLAREIQVVKDAEYSDRFQADLKLRDTKDLEQNWLRALQRAADLTIESLTLPSRLDYRRDERLMRAAEANFRLFRFAWSRDYKQVALRAGELAMQFNRGKNPEIDREVIGHGHLSVNSRVPGLEVFLFHFERGPEGTPYEYRQVPVPVSTENLRREGGQTQPLASYIDRVGWERLDLSPLAIATKAQVEDSTVVSELFKRDSKDPEEPEGGEGYGLVSECRLPELPLDRALIAMGSYLLIARGEGYADFRYPFIIRRNGDVQIDLRPVEREKVPEGWVYVPAGESTVFGSGGEMTTAFERPEERALVDEFLIRVDEVTVDEYAEFMNSKLNNGASAKELRALVPQTPKGSPLWDIPRSPTEAVVPRENGTHPVSSINGPAAIAFCVWLSEKLDRTVRLPTEQEWERAARGADGRYYPWGDLFLPTFCSMGSSPGEEVKSRRGLRYVADQSVFGVFDLAGNVAEYCQPSSKDFIYARGGTYSANSAFQCSTTIRLRRLPRLVSQFIGFRVVMELDR